jgi:hypothetical protein
LGIGIVVAVLWIAATFFEGFLEESAPAFNSATAWLMSDAIGFYSVMLGFGLWQNLQMAQSGQWQRLPMRPSDLFSRTCRRWMNVGVAFITAIALVFYLAMSESTRGDLPWTIALAAALTSAAGVIACAFPFAHWQAGRPVKPQVIIREWTCWQLFRRVLTGLLLCTVVMLPLIMALAAEPLGMTRWVEPVLASLPGTWGSHVLHETLDQGQLAASVHIIPLLFLVMTIPFWHARLKSRFCALAPDHQFVIPVGDMEDGTPGETDSAAEVRNYLRRIPDWDRAGLVDRLVFRFLTPPQKRFVHLACPTPPGWTSLERNAAVITLALLPIGWFFHSQESWLWTVLSWMPLVATLLFVMSRIVCLDTSSMAEFAGSGGPLSIRFSNWLWIKIAWARAVLALPLFLLAAIVIGNSLGLGTLESVRWGIVPWVSALAILPVWLATVILLGFAPTNWKQYSVIGTLMFVVIIFGFGILIFSTNPVHDGHASGAGLLSSLILLAASHLLLRFVLWVHRHGGFDLRSVSGLGANAPRTRQSSLGQPIGF